MSIVKLNDRAVKDATTFGSISSLGEMKFISKATASASASIEFSLGDYKEYQFYFVNCHPQNDVVKLEFNMSTDGGSNYNVTKTSTAFRSSHPENDAFTFLGYQGSYDLAQGTGFQPITLEDGNENDEGSSGSLTIFNPSSSTYVKHFISRFASTAYYPEIHDVFVAGYGNTTSPINSIKFQYSSGNIDAGEILLFGIN